MNSIERDLKKILKKFPKKSPRKFSEGDENDFWEALYREGIWGMFKEEGAADAFIGMIREAKNGKLTIEFYTGEGQLSGMYFHRTVK